MHETPVRIATLADRPPILKNILSDKLGTLKDAARIIYPGVGPMLYDWWEEINRNLFGCQMAPPGIQFGLTPHTKTLGKWRGYEQAIILHRALLDSSAEARGQRERFGERFAYDTLLHQMVHQYIDTVRGVSNTQAKINSPQSGDDAENGSVHNSPSWVGEINRLSEKLSLDCTAAVVRQRRVNGELEWAPPEGLNMTIGDLSTWPHSVRPYRYYKDDSSSALELKNPSGERAPNEQYEQKTGPDGPEVWLGGETGGEQADEHNPDEHNPDEQRNRETGPDEPEIWLDDEVDDQADEHSPDEQSNQKTGPDESEIWLNDEPDN